MLKGIDIKNLQLYKVTNAKEEHHGFQYKNGENIDKLDFNPKGSCTPGGLYFVEFKNIYKYLNYGIYIRKVEVLDEEPIYFADSEYKAHRIFLGERQLITDFFKTLDDSMLKYFCKQDGMILKYIDKNSLNNDLLNELYNLAFNQNFRSFQYMNITDLFEHSVLESILEKDENLIKYIPDKILTNKLIQIALEKDGNLIKYIPNKVLTDKLIQIAVQSRSSAIMYLKQTDITIDIINLVLNKPNIDECQLGSLMNFFPTNFFDLDTFDMNLLKKLITSNKKLFTIFFNKIKDTKFKDELLKIGVKIDYDLFSYVNHPEIDIETGSYTNSDQVAKYQKICEMVVKENGKCMMCMPEKLLTQNICKTAVSQYGLLLNCVPKRWRTIEMCISAVKQDGLAFQYIPSDFDKDKIINLAWLAIEQNCESIKIINKDILSFKMCKIGVQQNSKLIEYVPEDLLCFELLYLAVQDDYSNLRYLNDNILNSVSSCMLQNLFKLAVEKNWKALKFIPTVYKSKELDSWALNQNSNALEFIENKTEDIVNLALQKDGLSLKYINNQTERLCWIACEQNELAIKYVNKDFLTQELINYCVQRNELLKFIYTK